MKMSELFRRLSYGELSNLAMSVEGSGTIVEERHPQIIQLANEGLLQLYSKFVLNEKDVIIEQVAHITNYHLRRRFAETSASGEEYAYIKDLPGEPFDDDVIKILSVDDANGRSLPLNDTNNPNSLFTPQFDVLQVPSPDDGKPLAIIYQARHPSLLEKTAIDEEYYLDQEIILPLSMEPALLSYIGSKVYAHMNGPENNMQSQSYYQIYQSICMDIESRDLANQTNLFTHTKLEQRGFV